MMKFKSKETNVYFTSDTHYGHSNICLGTSQWDDAVMSTRNFLSLEEMNDEIVHQINRNIKEDDVLFHLGDWSFGGINNIWNLRNRINCKNVHLVLGNHDQHIKKDKIIERKENGHVVANINARGLFSSVQDYLEIEIDKQLIMMFHRPIEDFHNNERKVIHLHGHVHGKLNDKQPKNRLDVGIDAAFKLFGEYTPLHWNQINEIL